MLKYYEEIMNPKKKKQKGEKGEEVNTEGAIAPNDNPAQKKKKKPWEVRREKIQKSFNPELEKNGLPTSFGGANSKKRKERD